MSDETKVRAALTKAGAAGLTQTDIRRDVFSHHRTKDQLRSLLDGLVDAGAIETWKQAGNGKGGPHLQRFRVSMHAARHVASSDDNGDPIAQEAVVSMHPAVEPEHVDDWTPPDGEGWVKWGDVVRLAEAAVPPGFALRQGKKFKKKQHWTKKQLEAIPNEQYAAYGARRISHSALKGAVYRGSIERRGDWCRLVRDPVTTQRMWMVAVYQVLGQAHPTLSGEFTPKPPKTLASVMQEHLGRQLLPEEFVRRRPGRGRSWDPADMKLHSRLLKPSDVEENQRRLDDYRTQVEQYAEAGKRPRFTAKLPKEATAKR